MGEQRKGFILGLVVGAAAATAVTLVAVGGSDNQAATDITPDSTTTVPDVVVIDDVPQTTTTTIGGQSLGDSGQASTGVIPTPESASTLISGRTGVIASDGTALVGAPNATAFAIAGRLVYQFSDEDGDILIDVGSGADVLVDTTAGSVRLLAVEQIGGSPTVLFSIARPAVVEGLQTDEVSLLTMDLVTGRITDHGVVAGFETILTSASMSTDGIVAGVIAEGDAFLVLLRWDGTETEIIVPCFGGSCPLSPRISPNGQQVAYVSGDGVVVVYDLDQDRVIVNEDLSSGASLGPDWVVTDFNGRTAAITRLVYREDGTVVDGDVLLLTIGEDFTEYGEKGRVTFVR